MASTPNHKALKDIEEVADQDYQPDESTVAKLEASGHTSITQMAEVNPAIEEFYIQSSSAA